jgi:hypothetical protein
MAPPRSQLSGSSSCTRRRRDMYECTTPQRSGDRSLLYEPFSLPSEVDRARNINRACLHPCLRMTKPQCQLLRWRAGQVVNRDASCLSIVSPANASKPEIRTRNSIETVASGILSAYGRSYSCLSILVTSAASLRARTYNHLDNFRVESSTNVPPGIYCCELEPGSLLLHWRYHNPQHPQGGGATLNRSLGATASITHRFQAPNTTR